MNPIQIHELHFVSIKLLTSKLWSISPCSIKSDHRILIVKSLYLRVEDFSLSLYHDISPLYSHYIPIIFPLYSHYIPIISPWLYYHYIPIISPIFLKIFHDCWQFHQFCHIQQLFLRSPDRSKANLQLLPRNESAACGGNGGVILSGSSKHKGWFVQTVKYMFTDVYYQWKQQFYPWKTMNVLLSKEV